MSRHSLQIRVDGPRPAAAWLMSFVSSAALWVTEQIPAWMIGVQCLAFLVSFTIRKTAPCLFKSAIFLNVLMAAITTITIRSALDGNPATISLAYFTSLSQGLQLLDARPRKSEFVLVALALFQIILASNLTDSVFFPPLVLVFLVTVTWTLLVHTLRLEAAEAGDPGAASAALTRDLRRMTIVATTACLMLSVVIFVLFPRLKTNILRAGMGRGLALSGFSDRVSLGDVGKIRLDHSVVLRVESIEGPLPEPGDAYWRGLAFDEFDGRDWSISSAERIARRKPISGIGRFGIEFHPRQEEDTIAQRIIREPIRSGVIFVPGDVQRIEGSFQHLERDRNGGLYLPGRGDERIRYTIWSRAGERDPESLRRDHATSPLEARPGGQRPSTRYLQLPDLDPRIVELTKVIVEGAASDFDRAWRIQDALRRQGRYTDSPPPLGDDVRSPIEAFVLGELEGHCEYFASAMVAMARTQGLPSRLVNGFAGGVSNELGAFIEVTQADAHAWVEIHFEQAGWVRFDPTPPDRRLRSDLDGSFWARLGDLGGALELWWFQRVVDFDSVDQIGALRGLWSSWRTNRSDDLTGQTDPGIRERPGWHKDFSDFNPTTVLAALTLIIAALTIWRHGWKTNSSDVPRPYREALRILSKHGLSRAATDSARDFAHCVAEVIPKSGAGAFEVITERYLMERFGKLTVGDLDSHLTALKNAVHGMGLRNQAHIR